MADAPSTSQQEAGDIDVAEFCRRVEEHLARVNDGQLIRIVGMGFELVRSWARDGVPLSIVCHGVSLKAERHRLGRSKRPLRLEFCEVDVREVYDGWRRAVGLSGQMAGPDSASQDETPADRRRPSLTRHLDRVIDRLSRATGRLDLPDSFRDALHPALDELLRLREKAAASRGAERAELASGLPALDEALLAAARLAVDPEQVERLETEAEAELAPYRGRLARGAWQRSVALSVDRLLRDRLGLPTVSFE